MNLSNLKTAKVLVVGDIMLDQYWFGESVRISPEAPVPVVDIQNMNDRLGGAANVAMNISTLGAIATLVGVVGDDVNADKLFDLLLSTPIKSEVLRKNNFKTSTKLRIVSRNQQLVRLDFENHNYPVDNDDVFKLCEKLIPNHDVVIISDYGKGAVSQVEEIIKLARNKNKIIVVDP